jgi:hypothetical protein
MSGISRRILFCHQCNACVPAVMMPNFTCAICESVFVEELDANEIPPELRPRPYESNWNWNSLRTNPIRTPSWAVQGQPYGRRVQQPFGRRAPHGINRQIPLPPQRQLFVSPDGRIVNQPPPSDVPSETEVLRRRAALQIRPYNPLTDGDSCSVCLDEHSDTVASSERCVHGFHQACYERWLEQKNKCPLCQEIVAP